MSFVGRTSGLPHWYGAPPSPLPTPLAGVEKLGKEVLVTVCPVKGVREDGVSGGGLPPPLYDVGRRSLLQQGGVYKRVITAGGLAQNGRGHVQGRLDMVLLEFTAHLTRLRKRKPPIKIHGTTYTASRDIFILIPVPRPIHRH